MGITGMGFREVACEVERIARTVRPTPAGLERCDEDQLAALRRAFGESRPIKRGDEAHCYLAGLGPTLHDLPESVRLHPSMAYRDGSVVLGTFPMMLVTVTSPTVRAVSIHCTHLQDGKKAPVAARKKLMQGVALCGGGNPPGAAV